MRSFVASKRAVVRGKHQEKIDAARLRGVVAAKVRAMEEEMKGKIKVALDEFNGKYPNIAGNHLFEREPAIVFRAPAPAASVGVVAAVPASVVMARDDPEEKLAKLKSMLDKGLITQAEYDFKKAEVLAGM